MKLEIGEARVYDDRDFTLLNEFLDIDDGWKVDYLKTKEKYNIKVSTKASAESSFKSIKLWAVLKDVKPTALFDVLLDPNYRKKWDTNMIDSYEIGCLNPNNDVGYYSLRCSPLKSRDFVVQRSWLEQSHEYAIITRSVSHSKLPPRKEHVRAALYLAGYVIRPLSDKDSVGSKIGYISMCDPRGSLPPWLSNKLTHLLAPRMIKRLRKACLSYDAWKAKHATRALKPWLYPEQMSAMERLSFADMTPRAYGSELDDAAELPDESDLPPPSAKEDALFDENENGDGDE